VVLHQKGWSIPLGVQLPKMGVVFTETGCARTGYLFKPVARPTKPPRRVQAILAHNSIIMASTSSDAPTVRYATEDGRRCSMVQNDAWVSYG